MGEGDGSLTTNMVKHMSSCIDDSAVSVRIDGTSNDIEHAEREESNTELENVKASLITMPTDVVMRIFEALPHATAACLGLTCRRLYACLKKHHPLPIFLGASNNPDSSGFSCAAYDSWLAKPQQFLWQLLKNWMGTKYKDNHFEIGCLKHPIIIIRFLHPKVYSELGDFAPITYIFEGDQVWIKRYQDYINASIHRSRRIDCRYQTWESRLPNPYNKGLDWFPEAIDAIKADVTRFEDIAEWNIFWSSFHVFCDNKIIFDNFFHECILDQVCEGFKLLGL